MGKENKQEKRQNTWIDEGKEDLDSWTNALWNGRINDARISEVGILQGFGTRAFSA